MIYLTAEELLYVAERALGEPPVVRDFGLLASAAARPQAAFDGVDAYLTLIEKAAALVHSIVGNHALVDGNKRLGLAALVAFLGMNGGELIASNDEAYRLIMDVADGQCPTATHLAERLTPLLRPPGHR